MKHIPDYRQFVNEAVNLKAAHLSSAEYQKAKKLKAFDSADWTWNSKSQLYDKVNEDINEAKFFRLPNKLNAMWELKNSVDYIVGKHDNGDDYNPAEMKTIEEFIKKIKQSAKAFKDAEEVKGTIYESVVTEASLRIEAYPEDESLKKLLKKHNIKIKIIDKSGPQGIPEVELTGNRKDLEKLVIAKDGWPADDLIDYIEESVNESAMSELDLLAKEAKDFKSFTKEVFKEFKNLPKKPDTLKWLEELYNDAKKEREA